MPRLVRRQPLLKRLQDRFDFLDILFQLQETFDVDGYDDTLQAWVVPCGVACNIVFIVAKLGSTAGSRGGDDVFSDFEGRSPSAWFGWMVCTRHDAALRAMCVEADVVEPTGNFPHVSALPRMRRQRHLHLLPHPAVPPFRAARG